MLDAQAHLVRLLYDLEIVERHLQATGVNPTIVNYNLALLEEIYTDFLSLIRRLANRGLQLTEEEKFALLERIFGARDHAISIR